MEEIKKEIEKITEQKEWKIPKDVWDKLEPFSEEMKNKKYALIEIQIKKDTLENEFRLVKERFWDNLHTLLPDLPADEKLKFNHKTKVVEKDEDEPEFLEVLKGKIQGLLPPGSKLGIIAQSNGPDDETE